MISQFGGGSLDIDRVLDSIEPADLDNWIAFRELEPDPIDILIETVKLGFWRFVSAWGGECELEDFDGFENAVKRHTSNTRDSSKQPTESGQEVTSAQARKLIEMSVGKRT